MRGISQTWMTMSEAEETMQSTLELHRVKIAAKIFVDTHERSQGVFARVGRTLDTWLGWRHRLPIFDRKPLLRQ
jgi:hypothetical protein